MCLHPDPSMSMRGPFPTVKPNANPMTGPFSTVKGLNQLFANKFISITFLGPSYTFFVVNKFWNFHCDCASFNLFVFPCLIPQFGSYYPL